MMELLCNELLDKKLGKKDDEYSVFDIKQFLILAILPQALTILILLVMLKNTW